MTFIYEPGSGALLQYTSFDTVYLPIQGSLVSQTPGQAAISGRAGDETNVAVVVDGQVASAFANVILLGADTVGSSDNRLTIGSSGFVRGFAQGTETFKDAVVVGGPNSQVINYGAVVGERAFRIDNLDGGAFLNAGQVSADLEAVLIENASTISFTNSGVIFSQTRAVLVEASDVIVQNSGEMIGAGAAAEALFVDDASTLVLNNSGLVTSNNVAVRAGALVDIVRNRGDITGDVTLGAGDDVYLGRAGGAVHGTVLGEAGEDALTGSSADDTFDGGDDVDVLRGRRGDDVLAGGVGADTLYGARGDDTLDGGLWRDELRGGRGDDLLTGGDGIDTFIINRRNGDDVIADFVLGTDVLRLTSFRFADFSEVLGVSYVADGGVMIELDDYGGGSVELENLAYATFATLGASDVEV
ncbi:MAG: hypothetical protein AAF192_13135 [Pseudomonadota bacterium]